MENKEIFEEVKRRIQRSCETKDHAILELSDLGFKKEDVNDGRLIHYQFKLNIDPTSKIEIDFRCYDQSGPFQNLPDMNKFTAHLKEGNEIIETYQDTYED